jgi:hypothetical protein
MAPSKVKLRLYLAICGVLAFSAAVLKSITMIYFPNDERLTSLGVHQSVYSESKNRDNKAPEILPDDLIYRPWNAFVIPQYKLIFFTFPKVACSEWKQMFMRMNGNPNWCVSLDPHDPELNKLETLEDYDPEIATAMMTSPEWTKAAIFREPKERVLSAFLDKAVNTKYYVKHCCKKLPEENNYYVKHCCKKLPDEDLKKQCIDNRKKFDSFLHFVTEYPNQCFDMHWEPQIAKIDSKWWPYIDVIGYQNNLFEDSRRILKMLYSKNNRDEGEGYYQSSAWDRYGTTGWGVPGDGCENRTHSFLEENTAPHKRDTGSHLLEWYTAKLEKLVEEKWAIEWQQERVKFPEIKLFANRRVLN